MAPERDPRHIVTHSHNISSWWREPWWRWLSLLVIDCARGAQAFIVCGCETQEEHLRNLILRRSDVRKVGRPKKFTGKEHPDETKKFLAVQLQVQVGMDNEAARREPCESGHRRRDLRPALASEHIRMEHSRQQSGPALLVACSHHWHSRGSRGCHDSAVFAARFRGQDGRVFAELRRYFRPGQRGSFLCVIQTHCEPPRNNFLTSLVHQPRREPLADCPLSKTLWCSWT